MTSPVAILLAGGLGTRMRPLTDHRPKHLLPLGGVALLIHQLQRLADAGLRDIVVATGYRADAFGDAIGDGADFGVAVRFVTEVEPLGTGGALANAARALPEGTGPVLVLNGDLLGGHDLRAHLARLTEGVDAVLHVVEVADARAFGRVAVDPTGGSTVSSRSLRSQVRPSLTAARMP